jgi:hypothetical protein
MSIGHEYLKVKNHRAIFVKFLGRTEKSPERIKFNDYYRKGENKIVKYSYHFDSIQEQAYNQLKKSGFKIKSRGYTNKNFIFLCENWGEDYISIKEIINTNKLEKLVLDEK